MGESPDAAEPLSVQDQCGSELNLFVRHNPDHLQKIPDLRAKIESILASLDSYSTALDEGKGIARHLNVPLLGSRLEDIIGGSFSSPCPRVVEKSGPGNDYGVTGGRGVSLTPVARLDGAGLIGRIFDTRKDVDGFSVTLDMSSGVVRGVGWYMATGFSVDGRGRFGRM